MTPQQFVAKWKKADLSERSAYQQHFLDLCELLNRPKPADVDPTGAWFAFEKGVEKTDGGKGFADVWLQGHFGWEYKGKHKNLNAAYQQLLKYREALENPPLLVVCDLERFEIHTNFTDTVKKVYAFDLDGLADTANILALRNVFSNPDALRPGKKRTAVTEEVAKHFARLADGLMSRGIPPHDAAHFLMKLMFCMFSEGIDLLPRGLFTKTVANAKNDPHRLSRLLTTLFDCMANGEPFGADDVPRFNGGLFADSSVLDLTPADIDELLKAAQCDWSSVEPTIFGTLFERSLDPDKRSQIGAHYTSRADIETLLRPVLMVPLQREWDEVRARADKLWAKVQAEARRTADRQRRADSKTRKDFDRCLIDFAERLAHVVVLDPACGSGNFLYVAINLLLDLEKEVLTYAADHQVAQYPLVRPSQLRGLEINSYAQELAQVVIWIGYLQWKHFNGYQPDLDPVLDSFENIRRTDAILDLSDPENPREPDWPEAEFIVGNPPFLGGSRIWQELGRDYQQSLWQLYEGRLPGFSDLCCYWFEKARQQIEDGKSKRAGLLATQGIRGGSNREVLKRIKGTGDIFFAESDRDWILEGASVHVSMVGFDSGDKKEKYRTLDGNKVETINANLSATADTTQAQRLIRNQNIAFIGTKKGGDFNIQESLAKEWLNLPNPHGKPNSDVLKPWLNGTAIVKRPEPQWIIDCVSSMSKEDFALYEMPYRHVLELVKPQRDKNKRDVRRENWWLLSETCPAMRVKLNSLDRYIATPRVSKYRVFAWIDPIMLSDDGVFAFAYADDYFFGVLHSRLQEVWARAQGTQVRERESGFRYTATTCFETFPFPEPNAEQRAAVAATAKDLDTLRGNWLNPPEWTKTETLEFPGSSDGPWQRYVHDANERGIGVVRYPRLTAKDEASAAKLKDRTLTKLYNEAPAWLKNAHRKLDEAVFAAYGWKPDLSEDELLARLLCLNLARSQAPGS